MTYFRFFTAILTIAAFTLPPSLVLLQNSAQAAEIDFEQDRAIPLVYLNVLIQGGLVADPPGKSGLTYFVGRMLLRGTHSRTKEEINLEIDRLGARVDVDPRLEAMIIRGAVLSSELEPYLALIKDIITQPSFPQKEIDLVKEQQISFIREDRGDDESIAWLHFNRFLFHGHPYGKALTGKIPDIKTFTHEDVLNHYDRLVHDSAISVLGSGDASPQIISQWADEVRRLRPDREHDFNMNEEVVAAPTPETHRRLLLIDKPDRTQTQIHFGQVGIRMSEAAYFPLYVANNAFGGPTMTATLIDEIRVKRGWSYGANSWFKFGLQPRSWQVYLFPAVKDTVNALALSFKLVEELREKGLSLEQFEFAKQSLIKKSGFMYNTSRKRVENKIVEKTLNLHSGFIKSYASKIGEVSFDQANAALKEFLRPETLTVAILATAHPLKAALAKTVGIDEEDVKVIPYTED